MVIVVWLSLKYRRGVLVREYGVVAGGIGMRKDSGFEKSEYWKVLAAREQAFGLIAGSLVIFDL